HAPQAGASQRLRVNTGSDVLIWMLSLLMHRPCVRAWLRLSVDGVERRPQPTPPEALIMFARDVDRFLRRQPEGRAALMAAIERAERRPQDAPAPPAPTRTQVMPAVRDDAYEPDEAAVDQLLESEPAAHEWLRLVVETDARAPLPEPPPNVGYFA